VWAYAGYIRYRGRGTQGKETTMTRYRVETSLDSAHEGPQWWAEVVCVIATGAEVEAVETEYATSWYATEAEAEEDARSWLWANRRRRAD
jgi:hypothetical protein